MDCRQLILSTPQTEVVVEDNNERRIFSLQRQLVKGRIVRNAEWKICRNFLYHVLQNLI